MVSYAAHCFTDGDRKYSRVENAHVSYLPQVELEGVQLFRTRLPPIMDSPDPRIYLDWQVPGV